MSFEVRYTTSQHEAFSLGGLPTEWALIRSANGDSMRQTSKEFDK
jgi:hypothetical protein